ncbi:MAG: hypothetical protein ACRDRT_05885, partial [Pseudonocardiaceae bacterium]
MKKELCPVRWLWRVLDRLSVSRYQRRQRGAAPTGELVTTDDVTNRSWRDREPLTHDELSSWLGLLRVCGRDGSCVSRVGVTYYDGERHLLPFIEDAVERLISAGHATLGEHDPVYGRQHVTITDTGRAWYEKLCARQNLDPYPGHT